VGGEDGARMTLVALSGSYGAGGSRIGPALAERLGVPFVDRAIPLAVAQRLEVPLADAAAHDERPSTGLLARLLSGFLGGDGGAPTPLPPDSPLAEDFRQATEAVLRRQADTGRGVILGRASVVLLRDVPGVLRVRLDGPPERRVRQAMALEAIDRDAAEERRREVDRAHAAYAHKFYGVDVADPSLYHVVLDSTALPLEDCVGLIAEAARALGHAASAGTRRD
jgi:cytidylate kinase